MNSRVEAYLRKVTQTMAERYSNIHNPRFIPGYVTVEDIIKPDCNCISTLIEYFVILYPQRQDVIVAAITTSLEMIREVERVNFLHFDGWFNDILANMPLAFFEREVRLIESGLGGYQRLVRTAISTAPYFEAFVHNVLNKYGIEAEAALLATIEFILRYERRKSSTGYPRKKRARF